MPKRHSVCKITAVFFFRAFWRISSISSCSNLAPCRLLCSIRIVCAAFGAQRSDSPSSACDTAVSFSKAIARAPPFLPLRLFFFFGRSGSSSSFRTSSIGAGAGALRLGALFHALPLSSVCSCRRCRGSWLDCRSVLPFRLCIALCDRDQWIKFCFFFCS